jgi:hypothetical protein
MVVTDFGPAFAEAALAQSNTIVIVDRTARAE